MNQQLQMQKKPEPQEAQPNGTAKDGPPVRYIPADEAGPQFDFSRVNRRWSKEWLRISTHSMRDSLIVDSPAAPGITDDEKRTVIQAKIEAAERLGNIYDEQDRLTAQVVTFVPRTWLSPDAPEKLDWSDAASLNWVLESKSKALQDALNEARNGGN